MSDVAVLDFEYCWSCSGTGSVKLPSNILRQGVADLMMRIRRCSACSGTGYVLTPEASGRLVAQMIAPTLKDVKL